MLTRQEIFDKVWDAFVVKGRPPAITPNGGCYYYRKSGNNTQRCAIGLFMPVEVAKVCNDLGAVDSIFAWLNNRNSTFHTPAENRAFDWVEQNLDRYDMEFLSAIQDSHDTYFYKSNNSVSFTDYIREKLIDLAAYYGLKVPDERA